MTMLKKIFLSFLFAVVVFLAFNYELLFYGYGQAKGQLSVIFGAKPIAHYLNDKAYPDSLKSKIRLIQEIRKFAFDSLGINYSDNYTSLYDQEGKPILWMLTACEPFQLKAKEWEFPILGTFSYKGYFDSTKAIMASLALKNEGFDVDLGEVSGWSTLGWLKDPILSSMLYKKEGNLANLIIHELTHGTLYVKDNVDYNENLASFVGDQGALRFLRYKYGINSKQYQDYITYKADYKTYVDVVLKSSKQLDSIYKSMPSTFSITQKLKVKNNFISNFKKSFDTIPFQKPYRFAKLIQEDTLMNNTFFLHYVRYRKQQDVFEEEFKHKFNSNFEKYFLYLKKKYPQGLVFSNVF
jgi:predicted aminopeptidase